MDYRVCYSEAYREQLGYSSSFDTLEDMGDRHEMRHYIEDNIDKFQRFAPHETGLIYGWAVELGSDRWGRPKPTAILIRHKVADWIWIDIDD